MLIDLHFHTERFSSCSRMSLEDGLLRAKEIGLDGVCLTEHDMFAEYADLGGISRRCGVAVFVGVEIFTRDGDILCFGLNALPRCGIGARELTERAARSGGATIAAHPYRGNGRGIGDLLGELPLLTAVEAFNGNTSDADNERALRAARARGLRVTGSSDAHSADRVGVYATRFSARIESISELSEALRGGDYEPVRFLSRLEENRWENLSAARI